jgi:hypothetical protein
MNFNNIFILFFFYGCFNSCRSAVIVNNNQSQNAAISSEVKIIPGADQTEKYMSYLKGKKDWHAGKSNIHHW